jgi:hypothetical protein
MGYPRDDLRSTAEALQEDADALAALEREKETLDPADPRLPDLARQVEELLRRMTTKAAAERELVDEIQSIQDD